MKTKKSNKETKRSKHLERSVESLNISAEPKKKINWFKWGAITGGAMISTAMIYIFILISGQAKTLNADESLVTLLYIMGAGWMFFMPAAAVLFIARKEVINKLKVFGRRSRVAIIRFIGGDSNEIEIIVGLKANTLDVGENKIVINPKKATIKDGIKVLTYVADNALAHDYLQERTETLKEIARKLSKKKAEDFHDIFSDPIRIDAKIFNETFIAAQQTNPDIIKKLIAFLTSKNILTILLVIAATSAAAAFLSLQANNYLNTIPICQAGTIIP